ncbi:MAG: hypothetical protein U9N42_11050 [Campylobacterota bacterium]|nr:hypothetical protein [Campylobacterota bacterium]
MLSSKINSNLLAKKLEKELWLKDKKSKIKNYKSSEDFDDIMEAGITSMQKYITDDKNEK